MSHKKDPLAQEDDEAFESIKKFAREEYNRLISRFKQANPGDIAGKKRLQATCSQFQTKVVRDRLREHFAKQAPKEYTRFRDRLKYRKKVLEKKGDHSEELQALQDELDNLTKTKKSFEKHFVKEKMDPYMEKYESSKRKKRVHDSISDTGTSIVLYTATLLCFSQTKGSH